MQQITQESQSWLNDLHDLAAEQPILDDAITLFELALDLHFETQTMLGFLLRGNRDDWAFYLDFGGAGRSLREIVALPLDVAPQLRGLLQASPRGIALVSATLYVDGDTAWFRSRIGLDACPALRIESPFDYATQCRTLRTSALGAASDPDFLPRAADLVAELSARTGRRTLVLLTSHRALQRLAAELEERGCSVLAQGLHGTRAGLARRFAATPGAILLGVDSFWEGVDFPGDALELLVIAKLPFAVPDEPLVAARAERLRAAGEDPFAEFILPEAVLRFRQGFGRLIRSPRDRGAVVLLDPRLETREYGERFLAALPGPVEAFETAAGLADAVADWFALVESAPRREAR
jgi:Rad3-related DNA helicase